MDGVWPFLTLFEKPKCSHDVHNLAVLPCLAGICVGLKRNKGTSIAQMASGDSKRRYGKALLTTAL
jgi:hypothetical protein